MADGICPDCGGVQVEKLFIVLTKHTKICYCPRPEAGATIYVAREE